MHSNAHRFFPKYVDAYFFGHRIGNLIFSYFDELVSRILNQKKEVLRAFKKWQSIVTFRSLLSLLI